MDHRGVELCRIPTEKGYLAVFLHPFLPRVYLVEIRPKRKL